MTKIYLSPSNQPHNTYSGVKTNEKAEMEGVAHRVKERLERGYVCEVVMATLSMGIKKNERPTECKNADCDIYCAIHSNAGGGGKATGAVGFYHPNSATAKTLATALVKELDAIAPVKSNRYTSVKSGMDAFDGVGYGEIRSPMQLGVPSVLVEVNFHDNATVAKWIVGNKDAIADAIVRAFVSVYKLEKKNAEVEPPSAVPTVDSFAEGEIVKFAGGKHYKNASAASGYAVKASLAKVTQKYPRGKHPLHLRAVDGNGKYIGGVYGWVDLADVTKIAQAVPTVDSFAEGEIVKFAGGKHFKSASAASGYAVKASLAKVTQKYPRGKHPLHLRAVDSNGKYIGGVYGWVDLDTVSKR